VDEDRIRFCSFKAWGQRTPMSESLAHVKPEVEGRDRFGYFAPGNRIGRDGGNPNSRRMAELKRALIACGTQEDIQKLYSTLLTAALEGDVQAAKLLLDHLVGRPSQSIELTGAEGASGRMLIELVHKVARPNADYADRDPSGAREPGALPSGSA
jgi:hypothetical protein